MHVARSWRNVSLITWRDEREKIGLMTNATSSMCCGGVIKGSSRGNQGVIKATSSMICGPEARNKHLAQISRAHLAHISRISRAYLACDGWCSENRIKSSSAYEDLSAPTSMLVLTMATPTTWLDTSATKAASSRGRTYI